MQQHDVRPQRLLRSLRDPPATMGPRQPLAARLMPSTLLLVLVLSLPSLLCRAYSVPTGPGTTLERGVGDPCRMGEESAPPTYHYAAAPDAEGSGGDAAAVDVDAAAPSPDLDLPGSCGEVPEGGRGGNAGEGLGGAGVGGNRVAGVAGVAEMEEGDGAGDAYEPTPEDRLVDEAWTLRGAGRLEDAVALLGNASLALRRGRKALLSRGQLLCLLGRIDEAQTDFLAGVALCQAEGGQDFHDSMAQNAHIDLGTACIRMAEETRYARGVNSQVKALALYRRAGEFLRVVVDGFPDSEVRVFAMSCACVHCIVCESEAGACDVIERICVCEQIRTHMAAHWGCERVCMHGCAWGLQACVHAWLCLGIVSVCACMAVLGDCKRVCLHGCAWGLRATVPAHNLPVLL